MKALSSIGAVRRGRPFLFLLGLVAASAASSQTVAPVRQPPASLAPLPLHVGGRVANGPGGMLQRQWPGTYFETAVAGSSLFFRIGEGDVSLRISSDGGAPVALVKPAPGTYRIAGLGPGTHVVRVQVASESQSGPSAFGGFLAAPGVAAAPLPERRRTIEFIGDSYTVGYGNTSPKRQCSKEEIWETTDTAKGVPGLVGAHYGADYQVNAISGRGIVRNYDGFVADSLPQAYPFALFDHSARSDEPGWEPQLIVIALGGNDFSTDLHPGEKWPDRAALRADYEATFAAFVAKLHREHPNARFLFWEANPSDEISGEIRAVADRVKAAGGPSIDYVPVSGLDMSGCDYHPSTADDATIAAALDQKIDTYSGLWDQAKGERG